MDATRQVKIYVAEGAVADEAWASALLQGLALIRRFASGHALLQSWTEDGSPDLVFAADVLADMSGFELCRQLTMRSGGKTPVVLFGAQVNEAFIHEADEAGAIDVLRQPLNAQLLRMRIRGQVLRPAQLDAVSAAQESAPLPARSEFMVTHDLVTGLPNRRHLIELLDRACRRAQKDGAPIAVFALGIDHYASLRASLDRDRFDRLLSAIAVSVQRGLRPTDFVTRFSDEMFVAVLAQGSADTAETASRRAHEIADRTAVNLREDLVLDGEDQSLPVHTAVAIYPHDGRNAVDLIRHLEQLLVIERAEPVERRNASSEERARVMAMEIQLKQAIDNDRLVPHYQPKVHALSGRVVGGEALIRWPLRGGEFLCPDDFVPVAESGGLIQSLDEHVLGAVCRQIADWQLHFDDFRIAVNLSALKLHTRGIFERLQHLFDVTGAQARHLELEITESALITDFDAASSWLGAVREMGVTVALDDFGTGYSSLAYLRRLPLDAIKIDQSFVSGLEHDGSTVAIVRAMIAMAKALGMTVVAEGVETPGQAAMLARLGCDALQGFLFSAAVPAPSFATLMQNRDQVFRHLMTSA